MIYGYYNEDTGLSSIDVYNNPEYISYRNSHAKNQLLFMHTHPNNSDLSYGDIWNLIMTDSLYAVTAVCNNGGVHIAYKGEQFDSSDLKTRLIRFRLVNQYKSEQEKDKLKHDVLKRIYSEQSRYNIIFKYSIRR